jgi:hypothetical protein
VTEGRSTMHNEDIELDETGAEAVTGGVAIKYITPEQAFKQGYEAIAVMPHATLMKNMKTGKEIVVPDTK